MSGLAEILNYCPTIKSKIEHFVATLANLTNDELLAADRECDRTMEEAIVCKALIYAEKRRRGFELPPNRLHHFFEMVYRGELLPGVIERFGGGEFIQKISRWPLEEQNRVIDHDFRWPVVMPDAVDATDNRMLCWQEMTQAQRRQILGEHGLRGIDAQLAEIRQPRSISSFASLTIRMPISKLKRLGSYANRKRLDPGALLLQLAEDHGILSPED